MIGAYEVTILWLSVILALAVAVVCVRNKCFLRYFFLNSYLLFFTAHTLGGFYLLRTQGYNSLSYFHFYYTGDAILSVIGYLLVASFFDQLLRGSIFRPYVRPTLAIFFFLVIGVSGVFVLRNYSHLYSRFVIEFEQNMFFVGVLLTFLLWISMSYLQAESRRFVLLVSGLGIYFSAHAANYALRFLFPGPTHPNLLEILSRVPPLAYTFMVVLWLYAFWRVPEAEVAVEPAERAGARENLVKVKISSQ